MPLKRNYITKLVSWNERNVQPWLNCQPTESLFISVMNLNHTKIEKQQSYFSFESFHWFKSKEFMSKITMHSIITFVCVKCSSCVLNSIFHLVLITNSNINFISSTICHQKKLVWFWIRKCTSVNLFCIMLHIFIAIFY